MKLTIDAPEENIMSVGEVGDRIIESMGWSKIAADDSTPVWGFRFKEAETGRTGNYDVVNDELTWDDGRESSLFSCSSPDYCGKSLGELLDVALLLWCEDEDENVVLYSEM